MEQNQKTWELRERLKRMGESAANMAVAALNLARECKELEQEKQTEEEAGVRKANERRGEERR